MNRFPGGFDPRSRGLPVQPAQPFPVYPAGNNGGPLRTVVSPPSPQVPRGAAAMPIVNVDSPLSGSYPTKRGAQAILLPPSADESYDANGRKSVTAEVLSTPDGTECKTGRSLILTLGLETQNEDPAASLIEGVRVLPMVRAHVRFGDGAVKTSFLCDWLNGTQIAIGAESAQVTAEYILQTSPFAPEVLANPPVFVAKAMVSEGSLNQNSHGARLTELVQIAEPSGIQMIEVPPYATSFTVVPMSNGLTVGAWTALLTGYGTLYNWPYAGGGAPLDATTYNVENAFPHPNGARFLYVTNANDAGAFYGSVIFDLAF